MSYVQSFIQTQGTTDIGPAKPIESGRYAWGVFEPEKQRVMVFQKNRDSTTTEHLAESTVSFWDVVSRLAETTTDAPKTTVSTSTVEPFSTDVPETTSSTSLQLLSGILLLVLAIL